MEKKDVLMVVGKLDLLDIKSGSITWKGQELSHLNSSFSL